MLLIPIIPHQVKELRRVEHRATRECLIFAKSGLQAAMPLSFSGSPVIVVHILLLVCS